MGSFFAELKRRHIYRVAAAYAVVAWVLLQLVNNVAPALNLPGWAVPLVIVLLALGFPVALFFCWIQQLAPADGALAKVTTGKLDGALVGALVVVIALVSYQQLAPSAIVQATVQQSGVDAARAAAASPASAISLAVLPFANMSGDATQEFFSDGMTEEITSALAKIPDLRVVGRTSAFQFKDEKKDLRAIGQSLNATHLIEGSVRKAGERVRITVQLIKSDDGTHIWSENYDRQLTDVFAIQEDIARAIATSLRMPLGLAPGQNLVNNRGIDPAAYQEYLRARGLIVTRGLENVTEAASLLEQILARHPNYAPAWALLGSAYYLIGNTHAANLNETIDRSRALVNELLAKAESTSQRAVQLDPDLFGIHAALGGFAWTRGKPLEADGHFTKALALDSGDADMLLGVGIRLGAAGRLKEALAMLEKAHAIEPFAPQILLNTAHDRWLNGQNDAAIALAKTLRPIDRAPTLAMIYASMGRYGDAADALMEIGSDPNSAAAQAARLLRTAPAKTASPEKLPRLPTAFQFVYLYIGAPDRALDTYERRAEIGYFGGNQMAFVWHPSYAAVRKTERFKTLMRKAGLVDYWRAKGWPDLCRPMGADDFVCE